MAKEDIIEVENFRKWTFLHDVVELCTAVKGAAAIRIISELELDRLVYLDPDIGVFDSLAPISDMLDENSVLFTPHSTAPASTPKLYTPYFRAQTAGFRPVPHSKLTVPTLTLQGPLPMPNRSVVVVDRMTVLCWATI